MCTKNFKATRLPLAFLLAAFFAAAISGCLATRDEIREGVKTEPPTAEQQQIANNQANYQELESQTRQLLGRVETLENGVGTLNTERSGARQDQVAHAKIVDEKIKILEDAITKLESEQAMLSQKLETMKASQAQAAADAATTKDTKSASSKRGGASSFEQADGEFTKKKWKESIVLFQKYRDTSPTGKKYAEATYKIGTAFQELGMKTEAKSFYSEVSEKFPATDWAKKATVRLKALK
jgi:TolA-binding protein